MSTISAPGTSVPSIEPAKKTAPWVLWKAYVESTIGAECIGAEEKYNALSDSDKRAWEAVALAAG